MTNFKPVPYSMDNKTLAQIEDLKAKLSNNASAILRMLVSAEHERQFPQKHAAEEIPSQVQQ